MLEAKTLVLTIPITKAEKQKLDAFIQRHDILQISNYASENLDSIAPLEQFLFRKAVLLGGLDVEFHDFIVPNSARAREEIRLGNVVGGGTAQWHIYFMESSDFFLESDEVLAQGEYEKGIYTTLEKSTSLAIHSLADLQPLSAVTSKTWVVDWATLEQLHLSALHSASTRHLQFKMVQAGRADFTLQDFAARPDMSIEESGIRLYPVPGVKIGLQGTRHFFVSKKHPDGEKVYNALQKGLKIMRHNGEISRAYSESGLANEKVKNWILLK